jgi:hypothetical protein
VARECGVPRVDYWSFAHSALARFRVGCWIGVFPKREEVPIAEAASVSGALKK